MASRSIKFAYMAAIFLLFFILDVCALKREPRSRNAARSPKSSFSKRQIPALAVNVTTITSPSGATIRYKEPGLEGVCETTPGVNSYSGYVDLDDATHMFFWFFEARNDPANAPLTLWLKYTYLNP